MSHPETNPYFIRTTQHHRGDGRGSKPRPGSGLSQEPRRHGQDNEPSGSMVMRTRREEPSPGLAPGSVLVPERREDQHARPHGRGIVLQDPHEDQQVKPQGRQKQKPQSQTIWAPHGQIQPPKQHDTLRGNQYGAPPPQHQKDQGHGHGHQDEQPLRHGSPYEQDNRGRYGNTFVVQKTRAITWFGAVFCAIFWIVIFLGGLIVLIVYLLYRPRNPRIDISSVTLNAAYMDAGSMLNADLSLLVNFTNPNKKARVDFNTMIIDLYYGPTLISTQYIEPFSAARTQSRFVNLHMVTSQVALSTGQTQQLQQQINKNEIIFDVRGVFRVRSNLGSFLRYSYRLYSHCRIMVNSPPAGVLRAVKCRTKR